MDKVFVLLTDTNPTRVTGQSTLFKTASFWGYKSFTNGIPNNNTSTVYVGVANSGELPIVINTGSYFNWTLHPIQAESLSNFWVKGTSGDGLYIVSY